MEPLPSIPGLKRVHAKRLREVYRSAGWPYQDLVEIELLAAGLLEQVVEPKAIAQKLQDIVSGGGLRMTIGSLAFPTGQSLLDWLKATLHSAPGDGLTVAIDLPLASTVGDALPPPHDKVRR